jgi:hypothetical protein
MQIIRIFWGEFERYKHQIIEAKTDNLNEIVFVWGYDNYIQFKEFGFECKLIDMQPYDYSIANAHTFENHKSLIHKIVGIDIALETYDEVIFLDWDVRKVKELDGDFYKSIEMCSSKLQVPLYVYPKKAFKFLLHTIPNPIMQTFFKKLELFVKTYSYSVDDDYILPNTGFIYCSDKGITEKLLDIIDEKGLETVPDELCVFAYANTDIDTYIKTYEPLVIGSKEHGYDWWNTAENNLLNYKNNLIKKNIYFEHF